MTIRDFRIEDYDQLIALWDEAGLPYKPGGRDRRDNVEHQLKHPGITFLVAEIDCVIVGSVLGSHDGRKGWINRLAVSPAHRRRGIARRLVAEVERRLSASGIRIVACLVEGWNELSIQVFEKLGYSKHAGLLYFTRREDPDV